MSDINITGNSRILLKTARTNISEDNIDNTNVNELQRDQVIREFCLQTTAHAFPRLVFYQGRFKKIWIVILIISFIGTFVHVSLQLSEYFKYDIAGSYIYDELPVVFPDVTVCLNKKHISYTKDPFTKELSSVKMNYNEAYNYSLLLWKRVLMEKRIKTNIDDQGKEYELSRISTRSLSFEADLFANRASIIIICHMKNHYCDPINNYTDLFEPIKYYCVTVHISEKLNQLETIDKVLTLHIMNSNDGSSEEFESRYVLPKNQHEIEAGSTITLHSPNTIPSFQHQSFILDMKSNYEAPFRYQLRKLWKSNPLVKCLDEPSMIPIIQNKYVRHFNYSSTACMNLQAQNFIFTNCGCLAEDFYVSGNLIDIFSERLYCHDNINFLRNITINGKELLEDILEKNYNYFYLRHMCYTEKLIQWKKLETDSAFVNELCPYRCENEHFYVRTTNNKWITKSAYIDNQNIEQTFKLYFKKSIEYAKQLNLSSRNLESNFGYEFRNDYDRISLTMSTLNLFPNSRYGIILKETQAYPIISLLSDIGGIFGLWIGISILALFEIVEMIFKIIWYQLRAKYL